MGGQFPDTLIDVGWLKEHLDEPDLQVVECTVHLRPAEPADGVPYHPLAGRQDFEAAHIKGAVFADLVHDLSKADAEVHFMLPDAAGFADAMARVGVGDGVRVVIYSRGTPMWATRLWWMLRAMGFDDATVLDGGFEAWQAADGALESGPARAQAARRAVAAEPDGAQVARRAVVPEPDGAQAARRAVAPEPDGAQAARRAVAPEPDGAQVARRAVAPEPDEAQAGRRAVAPEDPPAHPTTFTPRPRPELMVDAGFMQSVLGQPSTLLINTLTGRDFRGEEPSRYGRPGRIPGSVNLPWPGLLGEDGGFLPLAEARRQLEAAGTAAAGEIVCYCGGGISATMALFQLHRLGYRNLKLYDASLAEWAKDPDLPIECG